MFPFQHRLTRLPRGDVHVSDAFTTPRYQHNVNINKQRQIYKCNDPDRYKTGAEVWPLLHFSFTLRCLVMLFGGCSDGQWRCLNIEKNPRKCFSECGGIQICGALFGQTVCTLLNPVLIMKTVKSGIRRAQALADISRSGLRCHIANRPNSAQLEGTSYHSPKLHPGLCSSAARDRRTHRWSWPIYISPRLCLTRNVIKC